MELRESQSPRHLFVSCLMVARRVAPLLVALLAGVCSQAQVELTLAATIDGEVRNQEEKNAWICADGEGNIISLGSMSQPSTAITCLVNVEKVGSDGLVVWERVFVSPVDLRVAPRVITCDLFGDVYFTFELYPTGSSQPPTMMRIVKLDGSTGNVVWTNDWPTTISQTHTPIRMETGLNGELFLLYSRRGETFLRCMSANSGGLIWEVSADPGATTYTRPMDMAVHPSGDVIVVGNFNSSGNPIRGYATRLSALAGLPLWTRIIGGPEAAALSGLDLDASGAGVYVVGDLTPIGGYPDIYSARLEASSGAVAWSRTYDGSGASYDYGRDIVWRSSGDLFILGQVSVSGSSSNQFAVLHFLANGDPDWTYVSAGTGNKSPYRILADSLGGIVFYGTVQGQGVTQVRFASGQATPIWSWTDGDLQLTPLSPHLPPLVELPGGRIVAGATWRSDATSYGYESVLRCVSLTTGSPEWQTQLQPMHSGDQLIRKVDQFPDKSLLATYLSGLESKLSRFTITGDLIWESVIAGSGANAGWGDLISGIGPDGDVYVCGSEAVGSAGQLAAARLDGASGAVVWDVDLPFTYSGSWSGDLQTAFDAAGNVIAVFVDDGDLTIVKLDRSSGALVWTRVIPKANVQEHAVFGSHSVDSNGDIYVTATGPISTYAIHTFKISGQTGGVLWTVHHGAFPGTPSGTPVGLALGVQNEVFVLGAGQNRIYLWKLDRSTGAAFWQASYQSDSLRGHFPQRVMVGHDGNPTFYALAPVPGQTEFRFIAVKAAKENGAPAWVYQDSQLVSQNSTADVGMDERGNVYFANKTQLADTGFVGLIDRNSGQELFRTPVVTVRPSDIVLGVAQTGVFVVGSGEMNWGAGRDLRISRFIQPIPVSPLNVSILTGVLSSGGAASLYDSDDQYLVVGGDFALDRLQPPLSIVVDAASPEATPSQITFRVESRGTEAGLTQKVELYDYSAQSYVTADLRQIGTSDGEISLQLSNPIRFVAPSTRQLRAKLTYTSTGSTGSRWTVRIDNVLWSVKE